MDINYIYKTRYPRTAVKGYNTTKGQNIILFP